MQLYPLRCTYCEVRVKARARVLIRVRVMVRGLVLQCTHCYTYFYECKLPEKQYVCDSSLGGWNSRIVHKDPKRSVTVGQFHSQR